MTAISDFKTKQDAHNAKVSGDLDVIKDKITTLNDLIAQLQGTAGQITPEDQGLLDQIEASGKDLETKADALAGTTPPPVPTP